MSDLIERDKAMKVAMWFGTSEQKYSPSFIKKRVMEIPSARPNGKWIWNENGMDWGLGCWCCSECDMRNPYIGIGDNALLSNPHNWAGSKYCPNCGADMRGE